MQATYLQPIWRTFVERRPLLMSVAVLAWSARYTVTLAMTHNTGAELYGVLTAALSTGAAIANLALLRAGPRSSRVQVIATVALLVVWGVVALGGIAGTVAHIVGPVAGHGLIDPRPRPIPAPLVFTLLGAVGALALSLGRRARLGRVTRIEKE